MVKRIIIADNDEAVRMAHRDLIQILSPDAEIDEVTDMDDLIRKVAPPSNYDLIITGQMPNLDGVEAFEEIRRFNRQIPIYLVSRIDGKRDCVGTSLVTQEREMEILREYLS